MPVDASIPLQGRHFDSNQLIDSFGKGVNSSINLMDFKQRQETGGLNNQLRQEQIAQAKFKRLDDRQQARTKSLIQGAAMVKPLLDRQDYESAELAINNRIQSLNEMGIDSSDSQQELELFRKDPQAFANGVDAAVDAGMKLGVLKRPDTSAIGGSTGALIDRLKRQNPNLSDSDALFLIKGGANKGLNFDDKGNVQNMDGFNPSVRSAEEAKEAGKLDAKLAAEPDIARETDLAKTEAVKQAGLSKAEGSLNSLENQVGVVLRNIDDAIELADSAFATGYGNMLSVLPNTEARRLNNLLDTVKANIGFDKLQSMRDNSPTGGALGQVSEFENKLLQAVNGALDPKDTKTLKKNLDSIKELYPKVLAEKRRAFNQDFSKFQKKQPKASKNRSAGSLKWNLE